MRALPLRVRAARIFLACFAGVCAVLLVIAWWDPGAVVEAFWEERSEQRYLRVWQRQAEEVSWRECRTEPERCPGKIVVWEVARPVRGMTCAAGNCSQRIVWTNEEQVPQTGGRGTMTAVARVLRVEPEALVLVFLGSPDAPYGGTTRVESRLSGRVKAPVERFDPHAPALLGRERGRASESPAQEDEGRLPLPVGDALPLKPAPGGGKMSMPAVKDPGY
ncbi:MAG: hypothetical protein HY748_05640 [Elusimicrobia bacterium]|nr:hypothetical protein [Elusimicrobiota bacterium]